MRKGTRARAYSVVTATVVLSALLAACAAKPAAPPRPVLRAATPAGSWLYPNGDLANTRVAAASVISSANVSQLRQAWTYRLTGPAASGADGYGSLAATPIVANGLVYIQDLYANVYALSLATGKLKWEYKVNSPEQSGPGPNGVAVADGVVYGDTSTAVFGLKASTGQTVWIDRGLLAKGQGKFEIQPQVAGGRVYLASAYGSARGGGLLMALSTSTGQLLWKFNTIVSPDGALDAIGVGGGGAWEPPLVGTDGSVTYGIGNPYQSAATAIDSPSPLLYTDSEVNLDAATGKLRWYYQGVTDDFKDYDMETSPIAASSNGTDVVIGAGKMGYVYEMNAKTGALIWKTPVGVHNGHDNDSLLALEHESTLKTPFTFEPGNLGGVLTNLASADGTVYVATIDLPFRMMTLDQILTSPSGPATGEIEALSLATGKVEWDTKVPQMPLGAVTVSDDLVFTTLYNGELLALDRSTGAIVYRRKLPTSTNAPIAVAGNAVLVPAGGAGNLGVTGGNPQLVVYTVPDPKQG
jgi:alcohol dehydrogenase (cytochrome c)